MTTITTAITMTLADVRRELSQAEHPLRDEMARGGQVAQMAAELANEECFAGARIEDIERGLAEIGGKLAVDWRTIMQYSPVASAEVDGVTVEVFIGTAGAGWYLRTRDGIGGDVCRDEADACRYDTRRAAQEAAEDLALSIELDDDDGDDGDDGDDDDGE